MVDTKFSILYKRYWPKFDKFLTTTIIGLNVIQVPIAIAVFKQQWISEGPFWRPGLCTACLRFIWWQWKKELVVVFVIFLPQTLRLFSVVQQRSLSFRRTVRKRWIHKVSELPQQSASAEDENRTFEYCHLDPADKEIRLLLLHPGADGDQIRAEICHTSLHDRPQYLALSYVWGSAEKQHLISLNGCQKGVTKNLFLALERLRNIRGQDAGIPFWIDALSIDQENELERNEQVRLMKQIYNDAYKVLVWLGPPTEGSELVLAGIKAYEARFYIAVGKNFMNNNGPMEQEKETEDANIAPRQDDTYTPRGIFGYTPDADLEYWEAVVAFLENPWWKRGWIAQEVSSPSSHATPLGNVEIIMGRSMQTISFRDSLTILPFVIGLLPPSIETWPRGIDLHKKAESLVVGIYRLISISALRTRRTSISERIVTTVYSTLGSPPIMTREQVLWQNKVRPMLDNFRALGCSDERDKIYASLPLVLPPGHPAFTPDYGLSMRQVYVQLVENFIKYEKCLSIFASRSGVDASMPSWAPDWRSAKETNELCNRRDTQARPIYNASGNRIPKVSFTAETTDIQHEAILPRRLLLGTRGVCLDHITNLGHINSNSEELYRAGWEVFVSQLAEHYAPTDEPCLQAYQRTLTGDVNRKADFYGTYPDATPKQVITSTMEGIEDRCYKWITQFHKNRQSINVIQILNSTEQSKYMSWKRGPLAVADQSVFNSRAHSLPEDVAADSMAEDASKESSNPSARRLSADDKKRTSEEQDAERRMQDIVGLTTTNRVLCITSKGYLGLVPYQAKVGDQIVVLFGGYTPFVLRERKDISSLPGDESRWQLIGESYVHGFMDGEALNGMDDNDNEHGPKSRTFVLV